MNRYGTAQDGEDDVDDVETLVGAKVKDPLELDTDEWEDETEGGDPVKTGPVRRPAKKAAKKAATGVRAGHLLTQSSRRTS